MQAQPVHPELAAIEIRGVTREHFLLRGAVAAIAAYGAGAIGPFLTRAFGQTPESTSDVNISAFALGLEQLEAKFYDDAVKEVKGLSGEVARLTREIRDHEAEHVTILTGLTKQLGGRVGEAPEFRFGDAFSDQSRYLALAQTFEDTGVSAYNGAAPLIVSPDVLDAAGRIVQIEARHAGMIRYFRKQDIAPTAFDKALTMKQVLRAVDPYVEEREE